MGGLRRRSRGGGPCPGSCPQRPPVSRGRSPGTCFLSMGSIRRVAIHEAMEHQTISIVKAGIATGLNSRTSVLAAANRIAGLYDDLMTARDNIGFRRPFFHDLV